MSTAAIRFEVQIRFLNVPEALVGVPLPAEVVSPTGSVQPVVLTMAENQPSKTLVGAPGQYLVRAELPTGRLGGPGGPGAGRPRDAGRTLSDRDLRPRPSRRDCHAGFAGPGAKRRLAPHRRVWAWRTFGERVWGGKHTLGYAGHLLTHARLEYGWFEKWGESSAEGIDLVLRLEGTPKQELDLPGSVTLHPHPGWVEDRLRSAPCSSTYGR